MDHAIEPVSSQDLDNCSRWEDLASCAVQKFLHSRYLAFRARARAGQGPARFTNAIQLPTGLSKLESAAPSHVAYVRQLVIDNLSPERLRRLGQDADRIVGRIDSPAR